MSAISTTTPAAAAAPIAALSTTADRPLVTYVPWHAPRNLLRAAVPLGIVAIWWIVSGTGLVSTTVFPSPPQIVDSFAGLIRSGDLQEALPVSLARAGVGLAIGLVVGVFFGVVNGLFRRSEELFDSSFQILRLIPFIATVPLFIIWFGIGEEVKIILITLACVFPVYLNTYAGVRHVDGRLIEAGKVFGLGPVRRTLTIVLPAALPSVLVGVRYSMGVSLLALVLAEGINSRVGLGAIITLAQGALRVDTIIAVIIVYALLGVVVDLIMRTLERRLLPWRA